jgi:two-component system OmpR family response regulator
VAVEGIAIGLTAREYALIEYLATRRGKVVSRTELYDHLFAEEDESYSNLLDVHVCNLRRKLGKDLIQTRRGHGYVID